MDKTEQFSIVSYKCQEGNFPYCQEEKLFSVLHFLNFVSSLLCIHQVHLFLPSGAVQHL